MSLKDEIGEWYDSTKIALYRQCPQRYKYRCEDNLVPEGEGSVDLQFGIAIHKALESIYDGTYHDRVQWDDNGRRPEITVYKYQQEFLDNYDMEPERGYKTRDNGLLLLTRYLEKWREEPFTLAAPPEQTFTMTFETPEGPFVYVGRLDLFIEWGGEKMPLDHKTTSRFGEIFDKQFRLSIQQTGYMKATGTRKSCINAMRVTSNINDESFVRKLTTRTEEDIARWERDIHETVFKIRRARKTDIWEQTDSACFSYNRTCEYYALCTAGSQRQRETIKQSAYRVEEWEPI